MHSSHQRGRLGVATASSGPLSTVGADISPFSVADRVSNIGLTVATITPQVEERISWLVNQILLRGQYAENAFELVGWACALEKEKDCRLLALILDLIFKKMDTNGVWARCGRLFLIFGREILPSLEDGLTLGADGLPLTGNKLFLKYLLDRCIRKMDSAWIDLEETKALAPEDSDAVNTMVEHWLTVMNLLYDLQGRSIISERVMHSAIEKQLSTRWLTTYECGRLINLLSPDEGYGTSFKQRERMDSHYSCLLNIVQDNEIRMEPESRNGLQTNVLDKLQTSKTPNTGSTRVASVQNAERIHPLAADATALPENPLQHSITDMEVPREPKTATVAWSNIGTPTFDPNDLCRDNKLQVTTATPLSVVLDFFTRVAEPPIPDYSSELESATCSPDPVVSSVMSDIWRATLRRGTHVAVKCVRTALSGNENALKHTVKELYSWSQQEHENILKLLGIALFKGRLAMVSEWMDQGSVVAVVNSQPGVDRYDWCAQVAGVVAWLHKKELIHGDLKGANILVSADGIPKLTDFGLAIMREGALQFSATGEGGGTMRWMAPELFDIGATKSCKTDVYALGMTMLEILTGQEPFQEIESAHQVPKMVSVERLTPKRPECLAERTSQNETLWAAMERCWVFEPSQRATAEEIEKRIRSAGEFEGLMKSVKRKSTCCTLA